MTTAPAATAQLDGRCDQAIILIGDAMISSAAIHTAIRDQIGDRFNLAQEDWRAPVEDVVRTNRAVELNGPNDVGVPALLFDRPADVIGIVTHFYPLSARALGSWPDLRFVATLRSGIENIDKVALDRRSIPLLRNLGRNANAVAEFAVAAMLAQLRGLGEGHHLIRTGLWRPSIPLAELRELSGLKIGLIGFGAVGSLVARRLSGFDPTLYIHDPLLEPGSIPSGAVLMPLEELLVRSDIVSVHARSTPENFHLLGAQELDLVRPDTIIINTARAELIDEDALIDRLTDGRIGGAVLDVFSTEPLPSDHVLRTLPNVTLSPHVAGVTVNARTNAPSLIARRIATFLDQEA